MNFAQRARLRDSFLCMREADKGASGGGSAAPSGDDKVAGEAAKTDPPAQPAEPTAPATEATKPSVFQRAAGMLKDKSELLTTISTHEATIRTVTAERDDYKSKFEAADKKATGYESQIADFEKTVNGLTAEKKTVEVAAADKVASLGFPAKDLPAASSTELDAEAPKTIEEFGTKHGGLIASGKTDEASKYYNKYAAKLGL